MNRYFSLLLSAVFLLLLTTNSTAQNHKLTPGLLTEMEKTHLSEQLRINIRLTEQYDLNTFSHLRQIMHGEQLRSHVVNELKLFANQKQAPLIKELNTLKLSGQVGEIKPLWIANVISCYASPAVISQLAERNDIERIDIDKERILIDPMDFREAESGGSREITYNVSIMNVPQVWELGYTGQGIVVAVLDTGVNYNHDDLAGNMWTHPDFPYHGWDFVNNNNNPMDYHGHGTHCAGTVAGNGSAGSQTGMAPSAKIMAIQVLGAGGGGSEAGVWAGIQFSVEYGAHIMSLSLGWQHAWNPDRASWRNVMDNALAAGVIAAVAAGNEGGGNPPSNVRTPGDIPAPWHNPDQPDTGSRSAVVTVGATDHGDILAGFSSRGPVTWQHVNPYNDYPYTPGFGLITPDVTAPGVLVKSLSHSNTSGYALMSGTSMAAPGAAGVMALALSKNPWMKPEDLSRILEETAVPMTPSKSNTYGAGRIDAFETVKQTNYPGPVYISHSVNDDEGNNNGLVNPQEFIKLALALENHSGYIFENIETTVTTDSPYVSMMDSTVSFGTFAPDELIEIADAVSFITAANIPSEHQIVFRLESTDGDLVWKNSFIIKAHAPNMEFGAILIDDISGNANGQLDPGESVELSFDISSNGQMDAENPEISISVESPFFTIHNQHFSFESMPPSTAHTIRIDAEVAEFAPVGAVIDMVCNIQFGSYVQSRTFSMRIGLEVESFETGDLSSYNWQLIGHEPWQVTTDELFHGSFSARSGNIDHSRFSVLMLDYEVSADDSISFYRRVSSEPVHDFLRFYINGQLMGEWSGEVPWDKVSYPVNAGSATFIWMYRKNGAVSVGDDAAWIDVVAFPFTPVTTAWAGNDAVICENLTYQLQGYAGHYTGIEWLSSGTGSFSDPFILDPSYTPGQEDIDAGQVVLTLTVSGESQNASDDLLLTIENLPARPMQPSGPDSVDLYKVQQTIYSIEDVENAAAYEWLLEPADAGQLSFDGTQANIDWNAGFLGEARLSVFAVNHCGTGEVSEHLEIELFSSVGIEKLVPVSMGVVPNPTSGEITLGFTSLLRTGATIVVSNMMGQIVHSETLAIAQGSYNHYMDLGHLVNGMYNLTLIYDQGISQKRIIIQK